MVTKTKASPFAGAFIERFRVCIKSGAEHRPAFRVDYTRSKMPAAPMPVPMHMVTMP